jgi:CheY-like chemotaxis protein
MPTAHILLVENDLKWQTYLKDKLEQIVTDAGCQCTPQTASSFMEAWDALAQRSDWHLLVADIALGPDTISGSSKEPKWGMRLVERSRDRQIPCLVVSGAVELTPEDVRDLFVEYRIRDFFGKVPFRDRSFTAAIRNVLQDHGLLPPELSPPPSPSPSAPPLISAQELRIILKERFNVGELRELCHTLGLDYEELPMVGNKNDLVLELIRYVDRRGLYLRLVDTIRRTRPEIPL